MAFNPNDYGKILTLESCQKIKIDDLVRKARQEAKRLYIESLDLDSGRRIDLVTSSTRYGGLRYWFKASITNYLIYSLSSVILIWYAICRGEIYQYPQNT